MLALAQMRDCDRALLLPVCLRSAPRERADVRAVWNSLEARRRVSESESEEQTAHALSLLPASVVSVGDREVFALRGGPHAILRALATYPLSRRVAECALCAVPCACSAQALTDTHPEFLLVPLATAVSAAMQRHPLWHSLQCAGCRALGCLARMGREAIDVCVDAGAVACVLHALSLSLGPAPAPAPALVHSACSTLATLCCSTGRGGAAAIEAVAQSPGLLLLVAQLRLSGTAAENAGQQQRSSTALACAVLAQLCSRASAGALARLAGSGAAEAIAPFLQRRPGPTHQMDWAQQHQHRLEQQQQQTMYRCAVCVLCSLVGRGGRPGHTAVIEAGLLKGVLAAVSARGVAELLAEPQLQLADALGRAIRAVVAAEPRERYDQERGLSVGILADVLHHVVASSTTKTTAVVLEALHDLLLQSTARRLPQGDGGGGARSRDEHEQRQRARHRVHELCKGCLSSLAAMEATKRRALLAKQVRVAEARVQELEAAQRELVRALDDVRAAREEEREQHRADLLLLAGASEKLTALRKDYDCLLARYAET
eukprot:m51a1_g6946 hypothetical protein (546) ;mRNA; r:260891-262684